MSFRAQRFARAPRSTAQAFDRPVGATVMLRPNGDHWVRLDINGVSLLLHVAQVDRLERVFAAVRAEIEADGHRSNDRLHMHPVKLGVF